MENRSLYVWHDGNEKLGVLRDGSGHFLSCAMPILSEGDIVGCVVSAWQYDVSTTNKISDEIESKLVQTAGIFLGRQMEG